MREVTTKANVENAARRLARHLGSTETPTVVVQHGNWSGYHIATVVTFTWPDGHQETLTLAGTKRSQLRSLLVAIQGVELYTENHMREA